MEQRPVDFESEIENFAEVGMCGTAGVLFWCYILIFDRLSTDF